MLKFNELKQVLFFTGFIKFSEWEGGKSLFCVWFYWPPLCVRWVCVMVRVTASVGLPVSHPSLAKTVSFQHFRRLGFWVWDCQCHLSRKGDLHLTMLTLASFCKYFAREMAGVSCLICWHSAFFIQRYFWWFGCFFVWCVWGKTCYAMVRSVFHGALKWEYFVYCKHNQCWTLHDSND